jgi:hypothetical protein
LRFAVLANVTCFDKPNDVIVHEGPPVSEQYEGEGHKITMMSNIIMCGGDNKESAIGWNNELVFTFTILLPELIGCYEKLSTVLEEGFVFRIRDLIWFSDITVSLFD